MTPTPSVELNNGKRMPVVGFGTFMITGDEAQASVVKALEVGYRLLDTSWEYKNEREIGAVVQKYITDSGLTREDLFITTKCWNKCLDSADKVVKNCRESLENLGTGYIDLYLMHAPWPEEADDDDEEEEANNPKRSSYLDGWKGMEKCVDLGLVKSIGVTNFNISQLEQLLDTCNIKPTVNQVECHPYLQEQQLIDFCKEQDICVVAYASLGAPGRPAECEPANEVPISVLRNPLIKSIASKYEKSPAQVCLRWQIQRGLAVIPKSVTPSRIQENFEIFDFHLSVSDMRVISMMENGVRFFSHKRTTNDVEKE